MAHACVHLREAIPQIIGVHICNDPIKEKDRGDRVWGGGDDGRGPAGGLRIPAQENLGIP